MTDHRHEAERLAAGDTTDGEAGIIRALLALRDELDELRALLEDAHGYTRDEPPVDGDAEEEPITAASLVDDADAIVRNERHCPTCDAVPGAVCVGPNGIPFPGVHAARINGAPF